MPRRTRSPILSPIRAYYVFERKRAVADEKALEQRARKRRARLKNRLESKAERDAKTEKRMMRDIDRMAERPSKLSVAILRGMIKSADTPSPVKVRAAALISQWALGDLSNDRKRRPRQKARGNNPIRP